MKKFFLKSAPFLGSMFFISLASFSQQTFNYSLSGKIEGAQKVYLYNKGARAGIISDSANTNEGTFNLSGSSKDVEFATLEIDYADRPFDMYDFILEAGKISFVKLPSGRIVPKGTPNNDLIYTFESNQTQQDSSAYISKYYDSVNSAREKLFYLRKEDQPNNDSIEYYNTLANRVEAKISSYMQWRRKRVLEYIKLHPATYFTAAYVQPIFSSIEKDTMLNIYKNLGPEIQASTLGQKIISLLKEDENIPQGTVAPTFATKDINDHPISLADFKGKYVLLDFWATWCGPCRASNPELIRIYNEFHNKGFEIIGIADDDKNIAGWKKAVKTDKTGIWKHVLRGQTTTDLANLYNVHSYPTQYLIDKDGKIISNVDLKDLESTLKQLMP